VAARPIGRPGSLGRPEPRRVAASVGGATVRGSYWPAVPATADSHFDARSTGTRPRAPTPRSPRRFLELFRGPTAVLYFFGPVPGVGLRGRRPSEIKSLAARRRGPWIRRSARTFLRSPEGSEHRRADRYDRTRSQANPRLVLRLRSRDLVRLFGLLRMRLVKILDASRARRESKANDPGFFTQYLCHSMHDAYPRSLSHSLSLPVSAAEGT
jgi:hypothetical protein